MTIEPTSSDPQQAEFDARVRAAVEAELDAREARAPRRRRFGISLPDVLHDFAASVLAVGAAFIGGALLIVGSVALIFGLSLQTALFATIGLGFVMLMLWGAMQ